MPTVVPETDTFAATVQRPNNGELADGASILQFESVDASRARWLYNRSRSGQYDITRASYSADPTGATDSTAAVQDAIDAADAAGGGVVYAPAGAYKFNSGLLLPKTVSLVGQPNGTYFGINHASANFITFDSGTSTGTNSVIYGIGFGGFVANTGNVFRDNGSGNRRVLILNCSVGDDDANLQGVIANITGSSRVVFRDCELHINSTNLAGLYANNADAWLKVEGGSIVAPATYSSAAVLSQDGYLRVCDVDFDFMSHVTGTCHGVEVIPTSKLAEVRGNWFRGASGPTRTAIWSQVGAKVNVRGNQFAGFIRHNTALLATDSQIELTDYGSFSLGGSTTHTVSDQYRSVTLLFTGTSPTITMPPISYPGQRITVFVQNTSGSPWTGVTVIGLIFGDSNAIAGSRGRSFTAEAIDRDANGIYEWVICGTWSAEYT